jgi:hypothetical protein
MDAAARRAAAAARPMYPAYRADRDARCYDCGGALAAHKGNGAEPGRGARQGFCAVCKVSSFYDLGAP